MLHTPTSQPLFIRHKSAAELLEKQAAAVARMPDDDKRWPAQVLSEMHKQLPFLSRFDVDIEMTRVEPEAGYAIGYAMLRNKTGKQRAAEELGKPTNKIRVPVIVADRLLQPFHVFEVGGKTYPLTQGRLESAMMNPSMFDGISDPPGTQSLLDQIYPPFQHRQGYGMMSGDRATTGLSKLSSAPIKTAGLQRLKRLANRVERFAAKGVHAENIDARDALNTAVNKFARRTKEPGLGGIVKYVTPAQVEEIKGFRGAGLNKDQAAFKAVRMMQPTGPAKTADTPPAEVGKTASGEPGPLREFLQQQELEKEAGIIQNLAGGVRNAAGAVRQGFSALSHFGFGARVRGALGSIRPAFRHGFQATEAAAARNMAQEAAGAQRFSEARAAVSAAPPRPQIGELPPPAPLPKTRTEHVPPEPLPTGTASVQAAKPTPGPRVNAGPVDSAAPKPLVRTTEGSPAFIAETQAKNLQNDFAAVAGSSTPGPFSAASPAPVRTAPPPSGGASNQSFSRQPVTTTASPPRPEGGGGEAMSKARAAAAELKESRIASPAGDVAPVGVDKLKTDFEAVAGSPTQGPAGASNVAPPRRGATENLEGPVERSFPGPAAERAAPPVGEAEPRFVRQAVSPNRSTQVREPVPLKPAQELTPLESHNANFEQYRNMTDETARGIASSADINNNWLASYASKNGVSPGEALHYLHSDFLAARQVNPKMTFEGFIGAQQARGGLFGNKYSPTGAAGGGFLGSAAGGATMLGLGALGGGMMMANKASENY